jgi:hypothetical protein
MGKKHGIWFDLVEHITIHDKVIENYAWLIKSEHRGYDYQRYEKNGTSLLKQIISFETYNDCVVSIAKEAIISTNNTPSVMTLDFSYNCHRPKHNYHLRYHSPHGQTYNHNSPWHDRIHRHEFDGKVQRIDVFSFDHRLKADLGRKYSWKTYPVVLNFLDHEDWPHVSEFLDEVSNLQ